MEQLPMTEDLVYGKLTTGAESDLQQLTGIARQMVGRWGMSPVVGPVTVMAVDSRGTFLPGAAAPSAAQSNGVMHVGFAVQKFVKQGKSLVAVGQTIATVTTDQGTYTSTQPFISKVTRKAAAHVSSVRTTQQASRICNVLNLTLGPLHLALLGLIIDLDKVVLNITADSNGGLLGGLLCGLAGGGGILGTATNAAKLTKAAKSSGLSMGPGFNVPLNTVSTIGWVYATRAMKSYSFAACGAFIPVMADFGFTL